MRSCKGLCELLQNKQWTRKLYENNRRCTKCEVYYDRNTIVCPCCKNITRGRKRSNNTTTRHTSCDLQSMSKKSTNPILEDSSNPSQTQVQESAT